MINATFVEHASVWFGLHCVFHMKELKFSSYYYNKKMRKVRVNIYFIFK